MKLNVISDDVKLGKNVQIYNFVNLYGCDIGDDTRIGAFVEIQKNVKIGRSCKIQSHSLAHNTETDKTNSFRNHNETLSPKIKRGCPN